MTTYVKDENILCPHCGCQLEDPVQDFVVPGRGVQSLVSDCDNCDKKFTVKELADGTYEVVK